jgi:hypothetical protein
MGIYAGSGLPPERHDRAGGVIRNIQIQSTRQNDLVGLVADSENTLKAISRKSLFLSFIILNH